VRRAGPPPPQGSPVPKRSLCGIADTETAGWPVAEWCTSDRIVVAIVSAAHPHRTSWLETPWNGHRRAWESRRSADQGDPWVACC